MTFKELRTAQGFINQQKFAEAIGKKNTTVSMWESGKSAPKLKDIAKIAKVLNVDALAILVCFE